MSTNKVRMVGIPITIVGLVVPLATGCNNPANDRFRLDAQYANSTLVGSVQEPVFDIELYDGSTLLYKESTSFGVFQMEHGKNYTLRVSSPTPGVSFQMSASGSTSSGSTVAVPAAQLVVGDNPIVGSIIGNYNYRIEATVGGSLPKAKSYAVGVTCTVAESLNFQVNPASVAVSSAGPVNMYNYSAPGVASGGSGQYECSWDFNGDGIRDNNFGPCSPVSEFSNHVDARSISVYVRDRQCNKVLVAKSNQNLAAPAYSSLVGTTSQVYITGAIAGQAGDPRVNLRHLSMNQVTPARAQCNYSRNNGKGTFTVSGFNRYGLSTSQQHGLSVSFSNIDDSYNMLTGAGSMSGANAVVSQVRFASDQSPDALSSLKFQGGQTQCTGQITPSAIFANGQPCSSGQSGSNNQLTVQAYGTFSCVGLPSSTAAGQTIDITEGAFYCLYDLVDSCIGGGGGGGGGIPPVQL